MHDSDDDFNYDDFIKSIDFNISDCAFIAKNGTDWDCYYDDYFDDYFYFDDYYDTYKMDSSDYVLFAAIGVATIISAVVIVGLSIPLIKQLIKQLKNGNFYQSTRPRQRSARDPPYSTYNLYLVYSALADLISLVSIITRYTKAGIKGGSVGTTLTIVMIMANFWINAFIVYEVLLLLRASKSARRINQPSLTRVNLQSGGIAVCMILFYFLNSTLQNNGLFSALLYFSLFFPVPFVIGVTIFVKCKGYLPPSNGTSPRDKAVRGLALFFFRVILIFLMIWIPVLVCFSGWSIYGSYWLIAIQPLVNFCLILSKPDVKKYITDLVTLSYIFGDSSCCRCICCEKNNMTPSTNATQGHERRRNSTTILGYNFSDVDDDDDSASSSDSDAEEANGNNDLTIEDAGEGNNQDMETGIPQ